MPNTLFYPVDANAADYPRPALPLLVPPSWNAWFNRSGRPVNSAFLGGGEWFIQSRYALAEAMRRAGVDNKKVVLLPSFHCRAIVEPILHLGAEPCFYQVTADLKPDFSKLTDLLRERGISPSAMILTHYFGFPNAVEEAEQFCNENGIVLIEDCAHSLYGQTGGRVLGSVGSYAVASLWKFLPVRDGSVLVDNVGMRQTHHLSRQPIMKEIKAIVHLVETWLRWSGTGRALPSLDVSSIASGVSRIAARNDVRLPVPGLKEFNPLFTESAALSSSWLLTAMVSHAQVAEKRRANYRHWLEGMRSVSGVRPLFPNLPEYIVPYAFPLLVDPEGLVFHGLKLAGIPMWRWEDMAITDCPVSCDYRLRLLQLPCHQGLHATEIEWMIKSIQTLVPEIVK